jgi:hypothetical protein
MAPLHCGEVPVKSAVMVSPATVSASWIRMGSGSMPSSSMCSVNV